MTKWTNEQLDAINKSGTNIIVSAGAGSGKTAVLTERVINKLNNGIHINELLILTFTNNAAAEMKERIKKRISKIPELKEELNLIESANITTFDAYVLSLVKKYHYYLDIDQNINIIDSTIVKQKKKEIINNIFNNLYENNNSQFINLITKYGVKNDKEIKRLILNIDDTLDLIIDKDYYLNNYINSYYSNDNLNNLFNEYNNILSKRIDSIKSSLYNLSFESDSDYFNKINDLLLPLLNAKNYGEIRSSLDISLPRLPNKSSDIVKYFKEQIKNLIDSLKVDTSFTKEYLINEVISTKEDAEVIILLLSELNKETNSYKLSHKIYEFNDISKLAIKLLKNNKDVCNDLKMSFKEIMIDEYQDTSDMQEEFIKLIENNNVYMVGDVKQSIYRFRNANPDIFKLKYDFYKNNNGGIKIDLNKNFRSRANVLASINDIFNHIMDNDIGNANYKDEHQLIYGNLAFDEKGANNYNNNLEINTYEEDDIHSNEEIEAFIIANDINNKINNKYLVFDNEQLRPATYKDFCILMDRTKTFDIYKKVFDYLKIPLNIYKDEDILFTDETVLIKNILAFIIDIKNNVYNENTKYCFASIARSYLFNLNDNEIYNYIINNKIKDSIIYQICLEISKNLNSLSNREIIKLIIKNFAFYEKIILVGNINYRTIILNSLLNKAEELNSIGTDIYGLNDYLNSLIEDKEAIKLTALINDNNSVTITNIHKSKGLEYKICYYSGIYKRFNIDDLKQRIIFNNKYGLIIPSFNNGFKTTFIYNLNKEKYIKEEISERIRLFYVALTRCKEKMIIVSPNLKDDIHNSDQKEIIDYLERINYRSFKDILSSIKDYLDKYIVNIKIPIINKDYKLDKKLEFKPNIKEKIVVKEKINNSEIIAEEHYSKTSNKIITEDEKKNMELGTLMHYILENLDFNKPNYDNLSKDEENIVRSLLNNKIFNNLKNAQIFKEYEFISESEAGLKTGIIDLMLVYKDYVDIIDYKLTHTDDSAYSKQLNGYRDYIKHKLDKPVNIYLYSLTEKELIKID